VKDLAKRKRVMARSMRLGHCICDPRQPCPCDVLREMDVCPCAGERLDPDGDAPVRLTELVDSPGCASKIDEASLRRILEGLPSLDDPRVIVGVPAGDDAGVYRLDDETALVQTVDVFAPSVDDPYTFGQIAAANSLSDVYAMGGRPLVALSIVGFPIRTLPDRAMRDILRGGIDKMAEANVPVVGGHSIRDAQVKAGFAVTGVIHPERIVTNAGARPGDALVLTKPLGTGIVAFAAQIGRAPSGSVEAAARSMAALNRRAAELMVEYGASACTDVTGFGLMGHLGAMAAASGVDVEIVWDDLPLLPGVLQCAAAGVVSGVVERNRDSSAAALDAAEDLTAAMLDVVFDAQTSGGLLVALPESAAGEMVARLREEGNDQVAVVGRVVGRGSGRVRLRWDRRRTLPEITDQPPALRATATKQEVAMSCCEEGHESAAGAGEPSGGAADAQAKFQQFLQAAGRPGALDAATKQAIAIALSVLAKCEPCVKHHVAKARQMGFTQEEIDEAAWMAIGFGGSPTMMFYNRFRG
jgi:selenide, water dikinase